MSDERLLDEYEKWLHDWLTQPMVLRVEQLRAILEEPALAAARRRDTRRIGDLLETGRLSSQGMAVLVDLLKTNFTRPVGHPPGPRRNSPITQAAAQLPAMIEFLKERHPELRPAFRKHAIALLAKKHGIAETTLRNRVDRGRRRYRVYSPYFRAVPRFITPIDSGRRKPPTRYYTLRHRRKPGITLDLMS